MHILKTPISLGQKKKEILENSKQRYSSRTDYFNKFFKVALLINQKDVTFFIVGL